MFLRSLILFVFISVLQNSLPLSAQNIGPNWIKVTPNAEWRARDSSGELVYNDRIWIFGGWFDSFQSPPRDVWSSSDGKTWTQVTEHAEWSPRLWFSSVTYRNRMWVLGGWSNNPSKNWGDVWYSKDGRDWRQLKSNAVWKERHEHPAYVFKDKLWVAGGHAQPLSNEVWALDLPSDFSFEEQ